MTQKDTIRWLFNRHGYVTNKMLVEVGLVHTGRNRIREMEREEFAPNGQYVEFTTGEDFLENRWTLKWAPGSGVKVEANGQTSFA